MLNDDEVIRFMDKFLCGTIVALMFILPALLFVLAMRHLPGMVEAWSHFKWEL